MQETEKKKKLNIDVFFKTENNNINLTPEGLKGIDALLDEFHGEKVRELTGVTRSAIYNYKKNDKVNISKRGRDAIETLVRIYNGGSPEADKQSAVNSDGLEQFADKELMLELKRRGYKVTLEV